MSGTDIQEVFYDLVHDGPLPLKQLAARIGKNPHTLTREANPVDGGAKLGVELVLPIMLHTGSVEPLRWWAAEMRHALVPLPKAEAGLKDLERAALAATKEFGDAIAKFNADVEDGRITPAEFQGFKREALGAVEAIIAWLDSVEAFVESGQGTSSGMLAS